MYPFRDLAGAGVAFKLLHGIVIVLEKEKINKSIKNESTKNSINDILTRYIDFASLGTVADCMPLIGENRIITTLGLRQMQQSESVGLRKFLEGRDSID